MIEIKLFLQNHHGCRNSWTEIQIPKYVKLHILNIYRYKYIYAIYDMSIAP